MFIFCPPPIIDCHTPQDAEPGTLVTTLLAMDPDFQLNGIVGYYFDGLTRTRGPFQIDRDTGEIRLRPDMDGALDREIVDFYEVRCLLDGRHAIYISLLCTD